MKDILNLFRRDAEHDHDWRHDIGKENLGMVTMKGNLLGGSSRSGGGVSEDRSAGTRSQPGVMEKAGAGLKKRDEGIYGRRW